MKNLKKEEIKDNSKQSKHFFKEQIYPSSGLNKYPRNNEDFESIQSHQKKNLKSYLDIFHRPSFRNLSRNVQLNAPFVSEQEDAENEKKYDYPVNIFKRFLFTWTRKVLSANKNIIIAKHVDININIYRKYFRNRK